MYFPTNTTFPSNNMMMPQCVGSSDLTGMMKMQMHAQQQHHYQQQHQQQQQGLVAMLRMGAPMALPDVVPSDDDQNDAIPHEEPSFEDGGCSKLLPIDFVPGVDDVIIGRGKTCTQHPGNSKLTSLIQSKLIQYSTSKSRSAKSTLIQEVMQAIYDGNGVGYVKKDDRTGRWYDAGPFLAREKTSQSFRDALAHRYRSSKLSKKTRRHNCIVGNLIKKKNINKGEASSSCSVTECTTATTSSSASNCDESSPTRTTSTGMMEEDTTMPTPMVVFSSSTRTNEKAADSLLSVIESAFSDYSFDPTDDPLEPSPIEE